MILQFSHCITYSFVQTDLRVNFRTEFRDNRWSAPLDEMMEKSKKQCSGSEFNEVNGSGPKQAKTVLHPPPPLKRVKINFLLNELCVGCRLLLEPECPLYGFKKKIRTVFDPKKCLNFVIENSGLGPDPDCIWQRA
jgi:hypothetical protein